MKSQKIPTAAIQKEAVVEAEVKQRQTRYPKIKKGTILFRSSWLYALGQSRKGTFCLVLARLAELWWENAGCNPVVLHGFTYGKKKVFGHTKTRSLESLEQAGFISVERRLGKSPLVTLLWRPVE